MYFEEKAVKCLKRIIRNRLTLSCFDIHLTFEI
jgi:hypothetical protein